LRALERTIEEGLSRFIAVGEALSEIRDGKLYRAAGFPTWDAYLRCRWHFKRAAGSQIIRSFSVVSNLVAYDPANAERLSHCQEALMRPLSRLSPELQCQAWRVICAIDPEPSFERVREVVGAIRDAIEAGCEPGAEATSRNGTGAAAATPATTATRSTHHPRRYSFLGALSKLSSSLPDPCVLVTADDEQQARRHLQVACRLGAFCENLKREIHVRFPLLRV
jgi:hypothetical protein